MNELLMKLLIYHEILKASQFLWHFIKFQFIVEVIMHNSVLGWRMALIRIFIFIKKKIKAKKHNVSFFTKK